jgi:serine protease
MTGIAPGAGVKLIPVDHVETGYDPAEAVTRAWGATEPGDAILIELQAVACAPAASGNGSQLGPAEWEQDVFDAISIATAAERIVVEAAGNGAVNLDHPSCNGLFDRNVRDSGAIIVGAGTSGNHARAGVSSFGARVNVQGWGGSVATTTTDLNFSLDLTQNDPTRRYTSGFSGTSSASAIVTGAVVAIQGRYKACRGGGETLSAAEMRDLLIETGTPQFPGDQSGNVGPLPDIRAALEARDAYSPKSCAARNLIHPALIEDGN